MFMLTDVRQVFLSSLYYSYSDLMSDDARAGPGSPDNFSNELCELQTRLTFGGMHTPLRCPKGFTLTGSCDGALLISLLPTGATSCQMDTRELCQVLSRFS